MRALIALVVSGLSGLCLATAEAPAADKADAWGALVGTTLAAEVVALDGDTLLIVGSLPESLGGAPLPEIVQPGKTRVRLWGVSAPEMKDPGGWSARSVLELLLQRGLGGRPGSFDAVRLDGAVCEIVDIHRPRRGSPRPVGICSPNGADEGADLAEGLLRAGFAATFRSFTYADPENETALARARLYDKVERFAREEKRGLWGLNF